MRHSIRWITVIGLFIAALQLAACAQAPATTEKIAPSKVEPIEGSDFKRVVLTEKAAERIGVQTVPVRAEPVARVQRVGGVIVASPAAGGTVAAQAADLSRVWVRVRLSASELDRVDRTQPARVLLLGTDDEEDDDEEEAGLEAELDDDLDEPGDTEETARTAGSASLHYVVNNPAEGQSLVPGQPVFVMLTLQGSGAELKIVPFAAVLYGVNGETWVYTNPEPLVFVRAPIAVDHIKRGSAFLSDGPPTGTQVVTVGGSLLYGAETGVSK
jgi:hypothetical protein